MWLDNDSTLAPKSLILNTLRACFSMFLAPTYMTHSNPNLSHTVAVATPCCPTPVSAMTLLFPNLYTRRA